MPLFSWSEKFSIGVDIVDQQHRMLFSLANSLSDLSVSNAVREALMQSLDELLDYTKYHFFTEETLMIDEGYPKYEAHKLEHDRLTQQTVAFRTRAIEGEPMDVKEILQFIYTWLTHHVMDQDKKIGTHLQMKQLKRG